MDKTKLENYLEKLRDMPNKIAKIFTDYHESLNKIRQSALVAVDATHYEREQAETARANAMRKAKEDAFSELKNQRDIALEREKVVSKQIDIGLGLRQDSTDTNENLLRESRMTAAWNRIKPILDQTEGTSIDRKIGELAETFGANADADSIAVILREIPLYLEARLSKRDAADLLPTIFDQLYAGLAGQTKEAQEALNFKRETETGMYQLKMAISYCEGAIKNGEMSFPMPTFKKGETLIVDTKGAQAANAKNAFKI